MDMSLDDVITAKRGEKKQQNKSRGGRNFNKFR